MLYQLNIATVGLCILFYTYGLPNNSFLVSSTLIQIPDRGNILLDAGEGTWGQLARHFGVDSSASPNVWEILRNLKCIFISHLHADHHSGLAKILSMRCRVCRFHIYLRNFPLILLLSLSSTLRQANLFIWLDPLTCFFI